jgi:hypothetical protein
MIANPDHLLAGATARPNRGDDQQQGHRRLSHRQAFGGGGGQVKQTSSQGN